MKENKPTQEEVREEEVRLLRLYQASRTSRDLARKNLYAHRNRYKNMRRK